MTSRRPLWSDAELSAPQDDTGAPEDRSLALPGPERHEPAPGVILEFELDGEAASRLLRSPEILCRRAGQLRSTPRRLVWHDTTDGALAQDGLALCRTEGRSGTWRLERLAPRRARDWLPAHAPPVLAEAAALDVLEVALPPALTPAASFTGRLRTLRLDLPGGSVSLGILGGTLRGVSADHPACRLRLSGATAPVAVLAQTLAETLPLAVPRQTLAAQAIMLSRGAPALPWRGGALRLPDDATTGEALGCVAGHLAHAILHWAGQVTAAGTPEPVHQMRVGVRRLRSALSVFRRACQDGSGACPWLDDLAASLHALAARLGVARDWDVFLDETGAEVAAALPQDRRITRLLAASARQRDSAYASLGAALGGQDWTRLAVRLALLPTLRPWQASGDPATLDAPARAYAARALDRRLKTVLAPGRDLSALSPPRLHELRKQAKRLRYTTEFFAPLFPSKQVRKYLPRLEELQEVLGAVNDTDVASALMAQLAGGADRAFAAGVVQGFGAAHSRRAMGRVARCWGRFLDAAPFWR